MDKLASMSKNQRIIIALVFGVFVLVTVSFYLSSRQTQTLTQLPAGAPSQTAVGEIADAMQQPPIAEAASLPEVRVTNWVEGSAPVRTVTSANVYNFQQTFPQSFIQNIANKFEGVVALQSLEDQMVSVTSRAEDEFVAFTFNSKNGIFSYASTLGSPIANTSPAASATEKATALVNTLIADPTVQYAATYKKTDKPGMTYVEFHRNWNAVGLPILNAYGIFNLPEEQSLSQLTFLTAENRPVDETIVQTSDRQDGRKRPNDFNTITVAVSDNEAKVFAVDSNIRFIIGSPSNVSVMNYQDALDSLKSNNYAFLYTSPEGQGVPTFDRVYPNNEAVLSNAVITETLVTYIEQPPQSTQASMEPIYLFKGKGVLSSGYAVEFVAGVQSSVRTSVFHRIMEKLAHFGIVGAQVNPAEDTGQKQGTFDAAPTTIVPTTAPVFATDPKCDPPVTALSNITNHTPEFSVGQLSEAYQGKEDDRIGNWYLITASTYGSLSATQLLDQIMSIQQVQLGGVVQKDSDEFRDRDDLTKEIIKKLQTVCPIRISGGSPTVFAYGNAGERITVEPQADVTFSNPALNEGWNVVVGANNTLIAGSGTHEYLYYEYKPVSFNRPDAGWNIRRDKLAQFADTVGNKLKLSAIEKDRLLFELNHAAADVAGQNLFVGVIPQSEVGSKLPLNTSVPAERVHFFVGQAANRNVKAPVVNAVTRSESMILEIGAAAEL